MLISFLHFICYLKDDDDDGVLHSCYDHDDHARDDDGDLRNYYGHDGHDHDCDYAAFVDGCGGGGHVNDHGYMARHRDDDGVRDPTG